MPIRTQIALLFAFLACSASASASPSSATVDGAAGWSASEGLAVEFAVQSVSGSSKVAWLDDRAMMLSALDELPGYAATIFASIDSSAMHTQFGANRSLPSTIERVLASGPSGIVVSGFEQAHLSPDRYFVGFVDQHGQLRWTLPGDARDALVLPGDRVVLRTGSALRGVDRSTGVLLWTRELNDFVAYSSGAYITLASTASYPLIVTVTPLLPESGVHTPLVLNLDPENGQTLWQWHAENDLELAYTCGISELAGDLIMPWRLRGGQWAMHVERRRATDGNLVWRSTLPDMPNYDGACGMMANTDVIAVTTEHYSVGTEFVGLDAATGNQRWRTPMPIDDPSRLFDLGSDGILFVPPYDDDLSGIAVQSFRSSDGQQQWQRVLPARNQPAVRLAGGVVEMASAIDDANPISLALWRLDPASGSITAQTTHTLNAKRPLPADAGFKNGIPYLLGAGRGPDRRGINLRRLDPLNGSLVWDRNFALSTAADSVTRASLVSGGADGVFIFVDYIPFGQSNTNLARLLLMRVDGSGRLVYQRDFNKSQSRATSQGWPLAHPSGEVSWDLSECTDPPVCETNPYVAIRLDSSGNERWRIEEAASVAAVAGESTLFHVYETEEVVLRAPDSSERWRIDPGTYVLPHGILDMGSVYVYTQSRYYLNPNSEQVDIQGLSPATGAALWSDSPLGPEGSDTEFGNPLLLPGGDEVFVSSVAHVHLPYNLRRRTPLLTKYRIQSGERLAKYAPAEGGADLSWTLGGPIGMAADAYWMRGTRYLDGWRLGEQSRNSVARIDPDSLQVIADYQLRRDFDKPVIDPGWFRPVAVDEYGRAWVESSASEPDGVTQPQLQVLPAPSDTLVDLQISIVDTESPLTALGPSRRVEVRLVNAGPDSVTNAVVQAESPKGEAWALLKNCELVGSGTCPDVIGSGAPQSVALDSGAQMILTYEVYVTGYYPQQRSDPKEILFVVDAEQGVGDRDLGDNVVRGVIRLGGFGSGFE